MDPGIIEQGPNDDCRKKIEKQAFFTEALQDKGEKDDGKRNPEKQQVDLAAIEKGDDKDSDQVIRDSQRGQENFQRNGDLVPEDGQETDRKGDVGGGRDAPSA